MATGSVRANQKRVSGSRYFLVFSCTGMIKHLHPSTSTLCIRGKKGGGESATEQVLPVPQVTPVNIGVGTLTEGMRGSVRPRGSETSPTWPPRGEDGASDGARWRWWRTEREKKKRRQRERQEEEEEEPSSSRSCGASSHAESARTSRRGVVLSLKTGKKVPSWRTTKN